MARFDFGGTLADFVVTSHRLGSFDTLALSAATLTMWSAQSGGTRYTDLVLNGSAVSSITVGADGQVPKFQGPDAVTEMWVDGGGARIRLVTLQGAPGPAGKDGVSGKDGLPGVNAVANDTATAAQINSAGSATDTALKAGYVGRSALTADLTNATAGAVVVANPALNAAAADIGSGTITGTGVSNFNNVLGGDGWATVQTYASATTAAPKSPNAPLGGMSADLSNLGAYDGVSGGIASQIGAYHAYTSPGSTHCAALSGSLMALVAGRADVKCTVTSGSTTVLDPDIVASDVGSRVASQYVLPGTTITSVTPGVSFVMSNPWRGTSSSGGVLGDVPTATTALIITTRRTGVGLTQGSTTVTDANAIAGDAGKRIIPLGATGWSSGTTISTVTPGVGYTLSSASPVGGTYTAVIAPACDYSVALGGSRVMISGTGSDAAGIDVLVSGNTASARGTRIVLAGISSWAVGQDILVLANSAGAVGRDHYIEAVAKNAFVMGGGTRIKHSGTRAIADGYVAKLGDRQWFEGVLGRATTDATPSIVGIARAAANLQMPVNALWGYEVRLVAFSDDGSLDNMWTFRGVLRRVGSAAPSVVGSQSVEKFNPSSPLAATVAPAGSAGLQVTGTGVAGRTIDWQANYSINQVVN